MDISELIVKYRQPVLFGKWQLSVVEQVIYFVTTVALLVMAFQFGRKIFYFSYSNKFTYSTHILYIRTLCIVDDLVTTVRNSSHLQG